MKGEKYFRELVSGKRDGVADKLVSALLKLLAFCYARLLRLRAAAYAIGLLPSHRLPVPVISIGNVVLGGTGKTPTVAWLAEYLMQRGKRVAVLSRGYGGSLEGQVRIVSDGNEVLLSPDEAGDEPVLLARKLPGLIVVIGSDRYQAGLLALKELKPDLFILDDGFQHLRLKRDLNILLMDASRPFADGHTLPAGFLREHPKACRRADLIIYTRSSQPGTPDLFPQKPSVWTSHALSGLVPLTGGDRVAFDAVQGAKVTAFSGIADPESFFDLLESCGVRLTATLAFPDHTRYDEEEIAAIGRLRIASRSTALITTEKDAVKLVPYAEKLRCCYAALLELSSADTKVLEKALEKFL